MHQKKRLDYQASMAYIINIAGLKCDRQVVIWKIKKCTYFITSFIVSIYALKQCLINIGPVLVLSTPWTLCGDAGALGDASTFRSAMAIFTGGGSFWSWCFWGIGVWILLFFYVGRGPPYTRNTLRSWNNKHIICKLKGEKEKENSK